SKHAKLISQKGAVCFIDCLGNLGIYSMLAPASQNIPVTFRPPSCNATTRLARRSVPSAGEPQLATKPRRCRALSATKPLHPMLKRSTLGYPRRHISTQAGKRTAVDYATDHKAHRRDLMRWLPGNLKESKCAQSKYEITYDYRNYRPDHCHNSISSLIARLTRIRLQLAIYFCLHRGSLPENTASWQAGCERMAAHRKSDRRRDYLCGGGLHKRE